MSETKFTPGEWVAQWSKYRDGEFIVQAGHPTYRVLARFDGDGVSDTPDEQSIANAHLIAAAPELYAALEQLMTVCTRYGIADFPEIQAEHVAAVLALAKARGELP